MELHPVLSEIIFTEELFEIAPSPTIIIDQPWKKIGSDEKTLLTKILKSIGHSLDSVTVKYQPSFDLSQWPQKPQQVIYFGEPIKGISFYELVQADGVKIVAAEKLSALLQNDEAKKNLWQALKKQFAV